VGGARTVLVSNMTTRFNYELRNTDAVQWEAAETLEYLNKWGEFIQDILIEMESELIQTGSGTITTVAGTDEYLLSDNSMGDLVAIPGGDTASNSRVRLSGVGALILGYRGDRTAQLILKDNGTTSYNQPGKYYLHNNYFCVLDIPDAVYTIYIQDYMPNWVTLIITSAMPYQNIFNNVFVEGVKVIAKNRENYGSAIDASLMELFQDRILSVLRKRQKQNNRMTG
jgi:hypothetical protein